MIVTCRTCGQRFETQGRDSKCPHGLLDKSAEPSRSAAFDSTDRTLIRSAIDRLYTLDKDKAASFLNQSSNPAMKQLAEECAALRDSTESDVRILVEFRKKLERAGA